MYIDHTKAGQMHMTASVGAPYQVRAFQLTQCHASHNLI